jgi:hypothetical protein
MRHGPLLVLDDASLRPSGNRHRGGSEILVKGETMSIEYVIFGRTEKGGYEQLLISEYRGEPITEYRVAESLFYWLMSDEHAAARKRNGVKVYDARIAEIDLSTPPDFAATVQI